MRETVEDAFYRFVGLNYIPSVSVLFRVDHCAVCNESEQCCVVFGIFFFGWSIEARRSLFLRLSKMAASSSSQPEHVTLSSNPDPLSKIGKKAPSRKGKGKENASRISSRRQGDISADGSKETEDSETPWDWTPLTDPSVSKTPPIFTKDGRQVNSFAIGVRN